MHYVTEHVLSSAHIVELGAPCVVIDDSGSPGQASGAKYLDSTRKTWVAVVLSAPQFQTAHNEFPGALDMLEKWTGGREFHLSDIYRGHKQFHGLSPDRKLAAIAFLANLCSRSRYPIIVQTLDKIEASKFTAPQFKQKLGALDLRNHEDLGLWMLLINTQEYLNARKELVPDKAYFVIDEGRWKANRGIDISASVSRPELFADRKLFSQSSTEFFALQLADFAAFSINRQQWLAATNVINEFDRAFLEILSRSHLNVINIPKMTINLDSWKKGDYDEVRRLDEETRGMKKH